MADDSIVLRRRYKHIIITIITNLSCRVHPRNDDMHIVYKGARSAPYAYCSHHFENGICVEYGWNGQESDYIEQAGQSLQHPTL